MATTRKFAQGTPVTASKSLEQIRATLAKFGATAFAQAEDADRVSIMFVLPASDGAERRIRYTMYFPTIETMVPTTRNAYPAAWTMEQIAQTRRGQEIDRLWRALAAGIKGKLVLVESGIETIEEAFYANIVLPTTGETIYEATSRQIAEGYRTGKLPTLLPGLPWIERRIGGG